MYVCKYVSKGHSLFRYSMELLHELIWSVNLESSCEISLFRCCVVETFAFVGCYLAWVGSYRRFRTNSLSHLQASSKNQVPS
jgi:hypothetical protein